MEEAATVACHSLVCGVMRTLDRMEVYSARFHLLHKPLTRLCILKIGDGGNGGHVVFKSTTNVNNFNHIVSLIRADEGEKGYPKNCHGKNASHNIVPVPVGTIVKNQHGKVVGDLSTDGMMFVAARGGAGGKGNRFFITEREYAPKICEHGAPGEELSYVIELRSMAHIGLVCRIIEGIKKNERKSQAKFLIADRLPECWQEYTVTGDNQSETENCTIPIHHFETASGYGGIRRLCTDRHC